jgi:hypothetical protein
MKQPSNKTMMSGGFELTQSEISQGKSLANGDQPLDDISR